MQEFNGLIITDTKLKRLNNLGRLLGEASITINNCLVIHGIKIIQLEGKRIVTFPHKQLPNGNYVDIVHPITHEFRKFVEDYIYEMYDKTGVEKDETN